MYIDERESERATKRTKEEGNGREKDGKPLFSFFFLSESVCVWLASTYTTTNPYFSMCAVRLCCVEPRGEEKMNVGSL